MEHEIDKDKIHTFLPYCWQKASYIRRSGNTGASEEVRRQGVPTIMQ